MTIDDVAVQEEASAIQLAIAEAVQPPQRSRPPPEQPDDVTPVSKPLCAAADGFSIHAASTTEPHDRCGLERMLRYLLRPAFSPRRLSLTDAGRVRYKLKRPWVNGATHLDMDPVAFIRRLALLIPRPGQNLFRYFGQFAPNAKHRDTLRALLPSTASDDGPDKEGSQDHNPSQGDSDGGSDAPDASDGEDGTKRTRYSWRQLLRRVFEIDITTCVKCGGPLVVLACITDPSVITGILVHLGLPSVPPTPATARNQFGLFDDTSAFDSHDSDLLYDDHAQPAVLPASRPPPVRWIFDPT